tara:strand:+ start:571 stop:2208 length:1638 start_codon:yes stop_codon:yes gene_type:complete
MKNKKILFVSEAPWFSTGYSVYTKEVLSRLCTVPNLEVAQLGVYASASDPEINSFPWKIYPNKPDASNPKYTEYHSNTSAQFGDFTFNEVLLDYQPDIVIDIRDWWMIEYQQRSPFRDFFKWAIMPTVDAQPQANQWIGTYETADAVFTYSEFGRDVLLSQCDNINFTEVAPPAASDSFTPIEDKNLHRESFGVSADCTIIGTVMRNQKRKLYPDLFKSFRKFLDKTKRDDVFLYCHTYFPDIGWDIPSLLDEFSLSSRVLFTYKCTRCGKISTDFFNDSLQFCKSCGTFTNQLVGISNPITEKDLSNIYNLFDVYVQYANSEGFGMPQLEAAYCGLPVMSTNYSAMESVIKNINGIPIPPLTFSRECETGCNRAIPNNEKFVDLLVDITSKSKEDIRKIGSSIRDSAISHYKWDETADKWLKYIQSQDALDHQQTWKSPPRIFTPAKEIPSNIVSIIDKINFIFTDVIFKPEWIGTYFWKRMLKDCTFGYRCESIDPNYYFNESHIQSYNTNKPFSIDKAFEEMYRFRLQLNEWEVARQERINK